MNFPDTTYNLRIELDTHECDLTPDQIRQFEAALEPLRSPMEKFPVSDLYITVSYQERNGVYRVKTALVLPGRTLAAGDLDQYPYAAFERCVRKLLRRVLSYQAALDNEEEVRKHQKGTHQEVLPKQEPDAELLHSAVAEADYVKFREAMLVYEEPIRGRVGRWVQRFPDVEREIGSQLFLDDLVEEVFLNAFERWNERPQEVPLGEWLDKLVDPSIRLIAEHPDEELENIDFARTLRET